MIRTRVKEKVGRIRNWVLILDPVMGKKPRKAPKSVIEKKVLIGKRVKELRGTISQDAIASAGGTSRRVVGEVERASTDYRIESLLSVIDGLEKQLTWGLMHSWNKSYLRRIL